MAKTVELNIPKIAEERIAREIGLNADYLSMMRVHVDEGGRLSHSNGLDLLNEVERLRRAQSEDASRKKGE